MSSEFMLAAGVLQGAPAILGMIAGVSSAGSFRAAQLMFGPVNTLLAGLSLAVLPEFGRCLAQGRPEVGRRITRLAGGGVCVASLVTLAILVATPVTGLAGVLAGTLEKGRSAIPAMALIYIGIGLTVPAQTSLRATGRVAQSFRLRAALAPLLLVCLAIGGYAGGAEGGAIGLAIALLSGVPLWVVGSRPQVSVLAGKERVHAGGPTNPAPGAS